MTLGSPFSVRGVTVWRLPDACPDEAHHYASTPAAAHPCPPARAPRSAALGAGLELGRILDDVPLDLDVARHGSDPPLEQGAHLVGVGVGVGVRVRARVRVVIPPLSR